MKKILILTLTFLIFFTPSFAQSIDTKNKDFNSIDTIDVSVKLKKEIKEAVIEIYGKEHAEEIFEKVILQAQKAIQERPINLIKQDSNRTFDWYKNEIIYMFYVDQFGVISNKEKKYV